jgi:hypothetical protein
MKDAIAPKLQAGRFVQPSAAAAYHFGIVQMQC